MADRFSVGDRVAFDGPDGPRTGIVLRVKSGALTVACDDGTHWRLAPDRVQATVRDARAAAGDTERIAAREPADRRPKLALLFSAPAERVFSEPGGGWRRLQRTAARGLATLGRAGLDITHISAASLLPQCGACPLAP